MRKMKMNWLVPLVAILLWNCGPKLTTNVKTDYDLDSYKTFAYLPNSSAKAPDKLNQSEDVGRNIIAAVNSNMERAGYTMDRDNPDLLVIINTNYDQETDVSVYKDYEYNYAYYPYDRPLPINSYYNNYYYNGYTDYGAIYDYDVTMNQYTDAGMVVSLVDRETKKIVWTGSIDDFYIYQDQASAEVADYVDNLFNSYPTISQK